MPFRYAVILLFAALMHYALWQFDAVHIGVNAHFIDLTLDAQRESQPTTTPLDTHLC